jgi:hypothetical protein
MGMMDPGRCACGHKSFRQTSYVRNDPVNLVDPDGRFVLIPEAFYTVWTIMPTTPLMFGMSAFDLFLLQQSQIPATSTQPTATQIALESAPSGTIRAVQALDDSCAGWLAGMNSVDAITSLMNTPKGYFAKGMEIFDDGTYELRIAQYDPKFNSIELNSTITDPSHYLIGNGIYINLLTATEEAFGMIPGSLDNETFWAIHIVHEMGHQNNTYGNDRGNRGASMSHSQQVINNCFDKLIQPPPL